jgi:ATP/maltotriose-dependent transcriptional regulator MalT
VALNHLGKLALQQGALAQAQDYYERSCAIYRDLSDKGGLATTLCGLGQAASASGEYRVARGYFGQALQIATEIRFVPRIFAILVSLGELLVETDQVARGLELLAFAQHHPACEHETQEKAQNLLGRYEPQTPSDLFASAIEQGQAGDLENTLVTLQAELPTAPSRSELEEETPAESRGAQPLVEPLTPREQEVLRLIVQGRTNKEIADELVIVVGTVKAHASNIYGKLGVNNRTQAVAKARELDLL